MKKEVKVILYCLFVLLFILYMIFATNIISKVLNAYENIEKIKFDEVQQKDIVNYSIDVVNIYNDFKQNVAIQLWAYCETKKDNSNKEIYVILAPDKSNNIAYKITGLSVTRVDVYASHANMKDIKSMNHGLQCEFSALSLKNGIYKLYLYCKENDENYGLVDTGLMLKKDGKGISKYTWQSTLSRISSPVEDLQAKSSLDSANITAEGYLQIVGWSFIDGLETADQSVYVRLLGEDGTTVTYDTQSVYRPDVGTAFKNDKYNNSGFKAVIPEDEVPDGDIKIKILVENGGNIYLASEVYMYPFVTSNEKDSSEVSESKKVEKNTSVEVDINPNNIMANSNLRYHFDTCDVKENLAINGWAYISDKNASNTSVYLAITKPDGSTRVFSTAKVSRSDVAKHFNNELYSESGFNAAIPLDAIDSGDNIITIIAEHNEMLKAEKTYTFSYTNEK